jgi:hypothetical protein
MEKKTYFYDYFTIHILFSVVVKGKIKIIGNSGREFELPSSRKKWDCSY